MYYRMGEGDGDLGPSQALALSEIAAVSSITMGELARRTGTTKSTTSNLVRRLEELKLVERRHNTTDDRREVFLVLTAAGRAMVRKMPKRSASPVYRGLQKMSTADVKELHRLLALLIDSTKTKT